MLTCPSCSQSSTKIWGQRNKYTIHQCRNCLLTFFDRNALPETPNDYQDYYPYLQEFDSARFNYELSLRYKKFSKQLEQINSLSTGKNLLDVGSGPGYFCKVAMDQGWNAKAVEISEDAKRAGDQYFQINYIDIEDVPEKSIDVITCHHVIEHVTDPVEFLYVLKSKLSENGIIVVQVPNQEPLTAYLKNKLFKVIGRDSEKRCALYVPDHLSGFTRHSLNHLFSENQFNVLKLYEVSLWHHDYEPFFLMDSLKKGQLIGIIRKSISGFVDMLGTYIGRGDWLVGVFKNNVR